MKHCSCRSKRVLGFQRRGHDTQTKLLWQGKATHPDLPGDSEQLDIGSREDDDAAMAAADNVDWNQL